MTRFDIRQEIQGLRAVAVLGVIAFHYNSAIMPGGFSGVDVFFVISGFIISNLILNGGGDFSWISFYWGRVKRILPAYYVMLSVVALVASILFVPNDFSLFFESLKSSAGFRSNQYFSNSGNYFAPSATELPLLHTWSLAVEMQFYLLLPMLLVWFPRTKLKSFLFFLIVAGFGFLFFQAEVENNASKIYFSLIARVPEFLLGAYLAASNAKSDFKLASRVVMGWLGLVLIGIAFAFADKSNFFNGMVLLPCLGAALIIMSRGEGLVWLSSRSMVWIGGLSFSLYLWHWPILAFIRYITQTYYLNLWWSFLFFIITIIASISSMKLVEAPGRRLTLGWRLLQAKCLFRFAIFFAPFLVSSYVNASAFEVSDIKATRYADGKTICHGQIIGNCLRGDSSVLPVALVLGDSHAAQLNIFFHTLGVAKQESFKVITASSCVTIKNFDVERIPDWARKDCSRQIDIAEKILTSFKVVIVAGMWSYQMESPAFREAFEDFLKETAKNGQHVIVLAQVPQLEGSPLRSERMNMLGFKINNKKSDLAKNANAKVEHLLATYKNANFLDFSDSAIFAKAPFYHGHLIYMDSNHLNEAGAAAYANVVAQELSSFIDPLKYHN